MKSYEEFNQIIDKLVKIERNGFSYDAFVILFNHMEHEIPVFFNQILEGEGNLTTVGQKRKFLTMAVAACKGAMMIDSDEADILPTGRITFDTIDNALKDQYHNFNDIDFNTINDSAELDVYINRLQSIIDTYLKHLQKKLIFEQAGAICREIVSDYDSITADTVKKAHEADQNNGIVNYTTSKISRIHELIDHCIPPDGETSKQAFMDTCLRILSPISGLEKNIKLAPTEQKTTPEDLREPIIEAFRNKILSLTPNAALEEYDNKDIDDNDSVSGINDDKTVSPTLHSMPIDGTNPPRRRSVSLIGRIKQALNDLKIKHQNEQLELIRATTILIKQYIFTAERAQDYDIPEEYRLPSGTTDSKSTQQLKREIKKNMKYLNNVSINMIFTTLTNPQDNNIMLKELAALGLPSLNDKPIVDTPAAISFIADVKQAYINKNNLAKQKSKELSALLWEANKAFHQGLGKADMRDPFNVITNDLTHAIDDIFTSFKSTSTTGSSRFF